MNTNWLCVRCLMMNENAMGPRVYVRIDDEERPVDLGAVPLIEAHRAGGKLHQQSQPIPMDAVTLVGGSALCWLHFEYGTPVRPPTGGPQPPAGWRRPGAR